MSYKLLDIIAFFSCILNAYCFAHLLQLNKMKYSKVIYQLVLPILLGILIWYFSFLSNEVISYVIMLFLVILFIKLLLCIEVEQAFMIGIFYIVQFICIKGISVGIFSLIIKKNLYQVITKPELYVIVLIITALLMSAVLLVYNRILNHKKMLLLLRLNSERGYVIYLHFALFIFMLFFSYNYYYNLDLVWFSFSQIFVSILVQILYFIILEYGIRVSSLLENEIQNDFIQEQLKKELANNNSYQKTFSEIEQFKYQYRESMLSLQYLIEQKDLVKLKQFSDIEMPKLIELLPKRKEFSNNQTVNAILLEWGRQCELNNINFESLLFISEVFNRNEKAIVNVIYQIEQFYQLLTSTSNGGFIKLQGKNVKQRLIIQISGSYNGVITEKFDYLLFDMKHSDQIKRAYLRLIRSIESLEGTIFWENDEANAVFKITVSMNFWID